MSQRYPQIHVQLHSRNPFAMISAVRQALRHSHVEHEEIDLFTEEALQAEEPERVRNVCDSWASLEFLPV